eukprot:556366-Pelagomonas_calceolata.AAC.1
MDTKVKSSHTADDVFGQIQVEIFGQNIRRICNMCRLGWESTPVMITWLKALKYVLHYNMQVMLNRLRAYAIRKGLTVNTSKSEVMHFNSSLNFLTRSCSSLPTIMHGDVALPEREQFKYLGMLVDKHMNFKVSEEHAVWPFMAAQQSNKEFVHEHDLRNRAHALIWLSKVYGIPAGLYACQVWGIEYLQEG